VKSALHKTPRTRAAGRSRRLLTALAALLGLVLLGNRCLALDPSFTEYQVKALFLLNFAKYVDWPDDAFADANTPVAIGIVGEDKFDGALEKAVAGKAAGGRPIVIRKIEADDDLAKCHILFISDSERKRVAAILEKVATRPVLTVSEMDHSAGTGGVINFVKKDNRIRLEIDLDAARKARLRLSSKLLSVADVVKGTP
jgi:hypothetical protein